MMEALDTFLSLTKVVESDWIQSPLARNVEDDGIGKLVPSLYDNFVDHESP